MTDLASIAEMQHPGDSIRERRTGLGWTQAELSERSGVSQADISRIENGRLDARWSTIHRLSEALETPAQAPRRSLANAHRGRRTPNTPATRWSPKGPVGPVASSGS